MENNIGQPISGVTTTQTFNNQKKGTCFFFHKWTKWVRYQRDVKQHYFRLNKTFDITEEFQERVCLKCGKIEREELNIP